MTLTLPSSKVSVDEIADTLTSDVDSGVPPDVRILSAESYGSSAWSKTAKIVAKERNGEPKLFFLKVPQLRKLSIKD